MKDRQRWQPEEDALLRAYVSHYGPKEWHLISQRMSKPLHRDPKSCLERWKNYLKPGIKKGSLTPQEQTLVISLQAKYGNKWKKIASEVPGRTAKRLGKWWEVFKEKQLKQLTQSQTHSQLRNCSAGSSSSASNSEKAIQGSYDHILETFAEKYVQPYLTTSMPNLTSPILSLGSGSVAPVTSTPITDPRLMVPAVSVGSGTGPGPGPLLPWMNSGNNNNNNVNNNTSSSSSKSTTPSPSVSLTLSPSEPVVLDPVHSDPVLPRFLPVQQVGTLVQYCKEVEEAKQNWFQHKKEATWRLNRLEQQIEAEKTRKRREKMEEIEAKIKCLREEETTSLMRMENEYREQLNALQKDAQGKEVKLIETWSNKQMKLSKVVEQINGGLIQHQHMISGNNHNHNLNLNHGLS